MKPLAGRLVVAIALLLLATTACNNDALPPAAGYAAVTGTIVDATTNAPIAGAVITIDTVLTATTDAAGKFSIDKVPSGIADYSVQAKGYQALAASTNIEPGKPFAAEPYAAPKPHRVTVLNLTDAVERRYALAGLTSVARSATVRSTIAKTTVASLSGSWRTVSVSPMTGARTGFEPERRDALDVGLDRNLTLLRVRGEQPRRRLVVDDDVVADALAGVGEQRLDVIGGRHAVGLSGLRHHVADVHLDRVRVGDFARDAADQEVRRDRGVERTGPEHDRVGVANRVDHLVERRRAPADRRRRA